MTSSQLKRLLPSMSPGARSVAKRLIREQGKAKSAKLREPVRMESWVGVVCFQMPGLKAVNRTNARGHWAKGAREVKACRELVHLTMLASVPFPEGPWVVNMARVGPGNRPLDDDGLVASLKSVRDQVAESLGVDDADPRITFATPRQERGPYCVRVVIWKREEP